MIALLMLPALSYSQSKSEKYPKQTVIGGDTVVILSLSQAVEMNESFLEMQSKIDSINSLKDTLESLVVLKQYEVQNINYKFDRVNKQLDRRYIKEHRLEVGRDIFLSVSMITGFVMMANYLNQQ